MLNKKDLLDGFSKTNVKKGETIVVHTSYKSLGGVEGGADTVIDASSSVPVEFTETASMATPAPRSMWALGSKAEPATATLMLAPWTPRPGITLLMVGVLNVVVKGGPPAEEAFPDASRLVTSNP